MEKSLRINLGSNYQLIVETDKEHINKSPFKNVYFKAFELVDEIVSNGELYTSSKENQQFDIPYTYNNIIAFTGDRGVGKTSAMVTFSNMLKNQIGPNSDKSKFEEKSAFKNKSYYLTKVVDPSLFNDNSNIMEVVISHLFSNLVNELKSKDCNVNDRDKSSVISAFETVFKDVRTSIKSKSEIYRDDAVEALISLSSASNLQKNMQELIKKFLEFVKKDFLVIQIDDIDLHTKQAHEMAEMLRKYLTQPNVIVLMALNPEQLEEVVYQQFLNDYKGILDTLKSDNFEIERKISEIRGITTRYMEKFLPIDRRVQLPTLKELAIDSSVVLYTKNNANGNYVVYCYRENMDELIMELIYMKTGLITYESERQTYLFMPKNLREFIYLIEKLCSMKTVKLTSFVQALRIRKYFDLGVTDVTYNEIVNDDGVSKYIRSIVSSNEEIKKEAASKKTMMDELNTIIDTTRKTALPLNGMLKLRIEKEEKWIKDIDSIFDRCTKKSSIAEELKWLTKSKIQMVYTVETDESGKLHSPTYNNFREQIVKVDDNNITTDAIKVSQLISIKQIFMNWCKDNLSISDYQAIVTIFGIALEIKNKYVLSHLSQKINNEIKGLIGDEELDAPSSEEQLIEYHEFQKLVHNEEYQRIISKANLPENISYGDINYLLMIYQVLSPSTQAINFVYAVRMCYNILILENDYEKENKEHSYNTMLFGGSLYNPIAQKMVKNSSIVGLKGGKLKLYDYKKNRNIALVQSDTLKRHSPFLLMQIRDFNPVPKTRIEEKNGPGSKKSLEFISKYFERYRLMDELYYELSDIKNKRVVIFDVLSFLFNLFRVREFEKYDVFTTDLVYDYNQLVNVHLLNTLFKQIKTLLVDDISGVELVYYKNYLSKLKDLIAMDYEWIEFNEFRDLNYLKNISDLDDIKDTQTFLKLTYETGDSEPQATTSKAKHKPTTKKVDYKSELKDVKVLIIKEKVEQYEEISKLRELINEEVFELPILNLIGKIYNKKWKDSFREKGEQIHAQIPKLINSCDQEKILSLNTLLDKSRKIYVSKIKALSGDNKKEAEKLLVNAIAELLGLYKNE